MFGDIGSSGDVLNLNLTDATINLARNQGTIAGINSGTIANTNATGSIINSAANGSNIGGLVGDNFGSVISSHANVTIQGCCAGIGGLVGLNEPGATITQSSATGSVRLNGGFQTFDGGSFGGLAGSNSGNISLSFSSGSVTGGVQAGGLVGVNTFLGTVSQSYSTSPTSGEFFAGGLVGVEQGGPISQSYAAGSVSANGEGFAGRNFFGPAVTSSYWDTQATGQPTDFSGAAPLTTAQLQSGILPPNFDPKTWSANPGQYPLLNAMLPIPTPVISPSILAQLSNAVYLPIGQGALPGFTEQSRYTVSIGSGGLTAKVFTNGTQIVIAFGGTELNSLQAAKDIFADASFTGKTPNVNLQNQVSEAALLVRAVSQDPNFVGMQILLTGHSLGGAVAQLIGLASGYQTTVFNAPGAGALYGALKEGGQLNLVDNLNGGLLSRSPNINYRLDGDIVSEIGTKIGETVTIHSTSGQLASAFGGEIASSILNLLNDLGDAFTSGIPDPLVDAVGYFHGLDTIISDLAAGDSQTLGSSDLIAPQLVVPVATAVSNVLDFSFPVLNGNTFTHTFVDPPGALNFLFQGSSGSPDFASLTLPYLEDIRGYEVSYETGSIWSPMGFLSPCFGT